MTQQVFDEFLNMKLTEINHVLSTKGHDYSDGKDRLSNFKKLAKRMGLKPLQVWYIYFTKHLDAIETFVREGEVLSEAIEGRFTDAINYLILGEALIRDSLDQDNTLKGSTTKRYIDKEYLDKTEPETSPAAFFPSWPDGKVEY